MADVDLKFVDEAVERIGRGREMVIPILQAIQGHYRYLPQEARRSGQDMEPGKVLEALARLKDFFITTLPEGARPQLVFHGSEPLLAKDAASILIITKGSIDDCNTKYAQGGIAAAIGRNDSPELHFKDTVAAGDGLCAVSPRGVRSLPGAVGLELATPRAQGGTHSSADVPVWVTAITGL